MLQTCTGSKVIQNTYKMMAFIVFKQQVFLIKLYLGSDMVGTRRLDIKVSNEPVLNLYTLSHVHIEHSFTMNTLTLNHAMKNQLLKAC